jgi:hypothetical protein
MGLFGSKPDHVKLVEMGNENPEGLVDNLDLMDDFLQSNDEDAVGNTMFAAAKLSEVDPVAAKSVITGKSGLFTHSESGIRVNMTCTVCRIASEKPSEVEEYFDEMRERLFNDSDNQPRVNALEYFTHLNTKDALEVLEQAKDEEGSADFRKEIMENIDKLREGSFRYSDNQNEVESTGQGVLKQCPECSTDLTDVNGIPRSCPGCGTSIVSLL